ncbi:hypothetical protein MTO96_027376 [Rhipicephalus appendiculatus]
MYDAVAEVQHRWHCLRQKFLRPRKVYYAKSGSGAADVEKSWVLMPHLMFLTDAIQRRSLPRKDTSASASLDGHAPDSDRETVEGLCHTFYIDSTDVPIPDEHLEVSSPADISSVQSSEVDACPVASPPGTSSVSSAESFTQHQNVNRAAKKKKNDLDDLMMSTLAANQERLKELTKAAQATDEDEHFLLSLKGLLAKVDDRKKERIKLQIYSLLVEAAYPPDAEDLRRA